MHKPPQMDLADFKRLVRLAVQNNAVDVLSLLFTSELEGTAEQTPWLEPWLAQHVAALLDLAEEHESVECSLMIINELEVKRQHRVNEQIKRLTNTEEGGADAMEKRHGFSLEVAGVGVHLAGSEVVHDLGSEVGLLRLNGHGASGVAVGERKERGDAPFVLRRAKRVAKRLMLTS